MKVLLRYFIPVILFAIAFIGGSDKPEIVEIDNLMENITCEYETITTYVETSDADDCYCFVLVWCKDIEKLPKMGIFEKFVDFRLDTLLAEPLVIALFA